MRENFAKILVIFLVIFLISCAKISENSDEVLIKNGKNIVKIKVEIADNDEERSKGLMFRDKLDENAGMLFIFDNEDNLTFWMKNTLIPLDMVFIDKDFKIVDIKSALPCEKEPCELYSSSHPAKYVLEVNVNSAAKNNIKIGDKIFINTKY